MKTEDNVSKALGYKIYTMHGQTFEGYLKQNNIHGLVVNLGNWIVWGRWVGGGGTERDTEHDIKTFAYFHISANALGSPHT